MKALICCFYLLWAANVLYAQQLPYTQISPLATNIVAGLAYSNESVAADDSEPEYVETSEDYRWQDSHEKERNIAFAACAASVIGTIYTATRSIESRSRAEDKLAEYHSLGYGSSESEFTRMKSEYNDFRKDGNTFAVASAALGSLAVLGLGFAIYWSF